MRYRTPPLLLLMLLVAAGCVGESGSIGGAVSDERLLRVAEEPQNWLMHGRTYDEQRFSTLSDINAGNVQELGLAWYFDVPTDRGMEATPIVVDGIMYVTGSWSIVYALDAETGKELWRYDPKVPKDWSRYACCDAVNRGTAVYGDNVIVATLDGYLVALNKDDGNVVWRTDTIDRKPPYTITGAPRVVKGLVIIGNGGAELGVRGYVSAYDATTGELAWRFYTVPGNPADGFENEAMKMAAETWTGEWWKMGGGGTAWDSFAYDPELDLLYVGTSNGSPWNHRIRSPEGGDNLFVSSIIALRPQTGEYVWHYQTTPGDTWDFTAAQHMILADVKIDGQERKVLMQAPKNGFFYVIDRIDGSLISAEAYVNVNWATGVDPETGRPKEVPAARYAETPFLIMPSPFGGHNWHPMAWHPQHQYVYLPSQNMPFIHASDNEFEFEEGQWNTGTRFDVVSAPTDPEQIAALRSMISGQLVAWDPVEQKEVWRFQHAGPWNGGVLATAGDLVFQGSLIGEFAAYDAKSGERLWVFPAQSGVAAAPVTYSVNGEQHVAVAAGWGTVFALAGGYDVAGMGMRNVSRILAFKRHGTVELPHVEPVEIPMLSEPAESLADQDTLDKGKSIYYRRCWVCHGNDAASGGVIADLRYASTETHESWHAIVLGGARQDKGMPAFHKALSMEDSEAIRAYVIGQAGILYEKQQTASASK